MTAHGLPSCVSRVPGSGVRVRRCSQKLTTASSLWNHNNPTKENDGGQTQHGSFGLLRKRGIDGEVDFLREALRVLVDGIMDAEVSAQIGAQHGERSPERVTYRNGYRNRTWDTRVGTMELHIPKLRGRQLLPQPAGTTAAQREGSAVGDPAGLPFGRLRTGVEGVSTRRVDDLIKALGCDGISSSQVSRISATG